MWDIVYYLLVVVFLAVVVILGAFVVRAYMRGTHPAHAVSALFGPGPPRRLDVVEHATIDARRRLLLIRRDDIEHLIMTGGPVDVVIETGITVGRDSTGDGLDSGPG
jgi:flagellar protein FliO/FliZ